MPVDHIRYDILTQDALRGVVRQVLIDAAKKGLPGEHHFFITFNTRAPGVRLSARMREQYPEEMTIVMQHQFWDLKVTDDHFEVGLSFGGVPETLAVPFDSIKSFFDPSIQFGLQFEMLDEAGAAASTGAKAGKRDDKSKAKPRPAARHDTKQDAPAAPLPAPAAARNDSGPPPAEAETPEEPKPAAEVVQLDRFRKK